MGFAKVSIHYADGSIDKVAIPVRFVDFEAERKAEAERQAQLERQSELNRRAELEHRAQLSRKVKTERSNESSYKSNSESKDNSEHKSTQTSTPAPIFKPQTSLPMSDNIKEVKQTTNSQPQVTSITKSSVLPSTGDKTETHYVVGALLALSSLLFGFAGKLKLRKISKSLKEK